MVNNFWMNVMAHNHTNPHNEVCKSNGQILEFAPILSDEECKKQFEELRESYKEYNVWAIKKNNSATNITIVSDLNKKYDIDTFIDFSLMVIDIIKEKRKNLGCYPEDTYQSTVYGTLKLNVFLDFRYLFEKYEVFKFYSDLQAVFLNSFTYKVTIEDMVLNCFNIMLQDYI